MPPDLVVADAAYKAYPGGVIALRCSDWMAGARGTLSSEADALSTCGTVVRDSQTVTTSIFANTAGALQEADDTLVIDFSTLPLEIGLRYRLFVSFRIEGDWDVSDSDTYRSATADEFARACSLSYSFTSDFSGTIYQGLANPRRRLHYVIGEFYPNVVTIVGTEVMYVRACAQDGTTIEYLLDQIVLLPYIETPLAGWTGDDFKAFGAQSSVLTDGADGGDANGKFTAHINPHETFIDLVDPGGDYQASPDSELLVDTSGIGYLANSVDNGERPAHAYSVHGANHRVAATLTLDDFSRTLGPDNWGKTPEGFGWWESGGPLPTDFNWYTDGTQGIINTDNTLGLLGLSLSAWDGGHPAARGASISLPDFIISGEVSFDAPSWTGIGTYAAYIRLWLSNRSVGRSWFVNINVLTGSWAVYLGNARVYAQTVVNNGINDTKWSGDFDISAWLAAGSPIGFRVEKKRYLYRVRIWDATGAEPGTWDFEDFLLRDTAGFGNLGTLQTYPYADDLDEALDGYLQGPMFPSVGMGWSQATEWSSYWKNIQVDYDPYGDPDDVEVINTDAQNVAVGPLTFPYGAWYFAYWGSRDWTTLDGGLPYLDFTSMVRNVAGAAQLQRAEALLYWFRINRANIIPMNWRSSTREGGWKRVLKGNNPI